MQAVLLLVLVGCASVTSTRFLCPANNKPFDCFEFAPKMRSCMVDARGQNGYVVCSWCKIKWETCKTQEKFQKSKYPERHCGNDYKTTPCTGDNSHVGTIMVLE